MMTLLFFLIAGHYLCDYPLQGQFLSDGKNPYKPLPGVPWYQCMLAHSFIHAGMVLMLTRSFTMAIAELGAHFMIDCAKCRGETSYNEDQWCHILCKVAFVVILIFIPHIR